MSSYTYDILWSTYNFKLLLLVVVLASNAMHIFKCSCFGNWENFKKEISMFYGCLSGVKVWIKDTWLMSLV